MSSDNKEVPLIDNDQAAAPAAASPIAEPGVPMLGLAADVTPAEPNKSVKTCVVFDDTGSMAEMLNAVKTVACDTIQEQQNHPALVGWDFMFSVVAFNDWDKARHMKGTYMGTVEESPTLTWCPFTKDVDQVKSRIRGLVAHGGADMPEDVAGGLKLVSRLDWSGAASKIIIFATDACGHGFTNGSDHFPNGDPAGETKTSTLATVRLLADMGIDFTFINMRPENSEPMRRAFKQVYEEALAANPDAGTFVTQDMMSAQPAHRPDSSAWACAEYPRFDGGYRSDEYDYDDGGMDRCGGGDAFPMCLPRMESTPSGITMKQTISDSTSRTIYHRTGLTPLVAPEPAAGVSSLGIVREEPALPAASLPEAPHVEDPAAGSALP